jgi:uncharacterized protein YkwD
MPKKKRYQRYLTPKPFGLVVVLAFLILGAYFGSQSDQYAHSTAKNAVIAELYYDRPRSIGPDEIEPFSAKFRLYGSGLAVCANPGQSGQAQLTGRILAGGETTKLLKSIIESGLIQVPGMITDPQSLGEVGGSQVVTVNLNDVTKTVAYFSGAKPEAFSRAEEIFGKTCQGITTPFDPSNLPVPNPTINKHQSLLRQFREIVAPKAHAAATIDIGLESDQLARINAERSSHGVPSVSRSKCLTEAARAWAQQMASDGVLRHSAGKAYYANFCPGAQNMRYGENVASRGPCSGPGDGCSQAIFNQFIGSDCHHYTIDSRTFTCASDHHTVISGGGYNSAPYQLVGLAGYRTAGGIFVIQIFGNCTTVCSPAWTDSPDGTTPPPTAITPAPTPAPGPAPGSPSPNGIVGISATPTGNGYWTVRPNGQVQNFGDAPHKGDASAISLARPIVGMASSPSGQGYWLVASDGGIFAFGDAPFKGSAGAIKLAKPVVGMASSPSGQGYWLVASDGGIFSFPDAQFKGSTGAIALNQPVVGMASQSKSPGQGYWLTAADGGIFAFGEAPFYGSTGNIKLKSPIVGLAAAADGRGYWFVAADGGVFAYGSAPFKGGLGNTTLSSPIVGMASTPSGQGYWLVASSGKIDVFGDAKHWGQP